ncbi:MAG TPA: ester cyclase [Ktedonobacterales bacterium]|nr:ester cyclase [Ktedonobacterales bacterium]
MSAEENRAVVRRVLDALDNADWAEIERHPGLYETRQHYPMNKAAVPDSRHTIETQVNEDDLIASVCTVKGIQSGPFFGIPGTGKPVSFTVLMVDRIHDGLIVHHWALPDLMSIFRQIGRPLLSMPEVSPPPELE